jgi:hypothetical protein
MGDSGHARLLFDGIMSVALADLMAQRRTVDASRMADCPLVSTASPTGVVRPRAWRTWLLRIAPYLVTGAVVAVLLRRYPAEEIARQMAAGHALRLLPLGLVLPFAVWLPYAAYDRIVIAGVVGSIAFRDVIRAKAASALLLVFGYFFGGGGYAVWIARTTRVGAGRAAGAILYLMASDLIALCSVAAASMWLGGSDLPTLRTIATWVVVVLLALILLGPYGGWLRLPAVFEPWRTVPRGRSLAQIAGRAGNIAIITATTWAAMRAFGIELPPVVAAMYVPVILFVTSLPINVAGLGVAQAAWLLLLPWASGPQLLAFQALWNLSTALGIALRGIPFVRRVVREIEEGKSRAAPLAT